MPLPFQLPFQAEGPVTFKRLGRTSQLASLPDNAGEPSSESESDKEKGKGKKGASKENTVAKEIQLSRCLFLKPCPPQTLCISSQFVFPTQEYKDLEKFGTSLLTRSSKLSDMIQRLEGEIEGKSETSPERKRLDRPESYKRFVKCLSSSFQYFYFDQFFAWPTKEKQTSFFSLGPRNIKALEDAVNILHAEYEAVEKAKMDAHDLLNTECDETRKKEWGPKVMETK